MEREQQKLLERIAELEAKKDLMELEYRAMRRTGTKKELLEFIAELEAELKARKPMQKAS
jgi:hypothetical protein